MNASLLNFIFRATKKSTRQDYWLENLIIGITTIPSFLIHVAAAKYLNESCFFWFMLVQSFIIMPIAIIAGFNVLARRMLDLGYTYWHTLKIFIPFVGIYYIIICGFKKSKISTPY